MISFERTNTRRRREISLIPLIDVTLFLLIFFMVAGSVQKFDVVPVEPPIAESGKLVDEGHVVIVMGAHGELLIDDEIVAPEDFQKSLQELFAANPNKVATLKADAGVPSGSVIQVMDQLKLAGAQNLSLVTQSLPGGK